MFNTMAPQLKPIAAQNVDFMLFVAKKAEEQQDYKYAGRVISQAKKWAGVAQSK